MAVTDDIAEQIDGALSSGQSFALAYLPGSDTPLWFGNFPGATQGMKFEVAPWLAAFEERMEVGGSPLASLPEMEVQREGTSLNEYLSGVGHVIERCRQREGKTVYSRIITGDAPQSWGRVAQRFFSAHPSTFRYIFHTPATKGWMGATPELLLDFNKLSGSFHTVALAGTRRLPSSGELEGWDEKNIAENGFVSRYILEHLQSIGCSVESAPMRNLDYGQIQHLCCEISGHAPSLQVGPLIDAINPTPALCGWPREDAVADIREFERHLRLCYGGFIGLDTPHRYLAFVNLRCTHFDSSRFCVFGGGGIVSASHPEAEWDETEAKTRLLRELLYK